MDLRKDNEIEETDRVRKLRSAREKLLKDTVLKQTNKIFGDQNVGNKTLENLDDESTKITTEKVIKNAFIKMVNEEFSYPDRIFHEFMEVIDAEILEGHQINMPNNSELKGVNIMNAYKMFSNKYAKDSLKYLTAESVTKVLDRIEKIKGFSRNDISDGDREYAKSQVPLHFDTLEQEDTEKEYIRSVNMLKFDENLGYERPIYDGTKRFEAPTYRNREGVKSKSVTDLLVRIKKQNEQVFKNEMSVWETMYVAARMVEDGYFNKSTQKAVKRIITSYIYFIRLLQGKEKYVNISLFQDNKSKIDYFLRKDTNSSIRQVMVMQALFTAISHDGLKRASKVMDYATALMVCQILRCNIDNNVKNVTNVFTIFYGCTGKHELTSTQNAKMDFDDMTKEHCHPIFNQEPEQMFRTAPEFVQPEICTGCGLGTFDVSSPLRLKLFNEVLENSKEKFPEWWKYFYKEANSVKDLMKLRPNLNGIRDCRVVVSSNVTPFIPAH